MCEHKINGTWHTDSAGSLIPAIWRLIRNNLSEQLNSPVPNMAWEFACGAHKQDLLDRIPSVTTLATPQPTIAVAKDKFLSGPFQGLFFKIAFVDEETGTLDIELPYKKFKATMTKELFEEWRKPVAP